MLLTDITDQILSSVAGGIRSDDNKLAEQRIEAKVHVWRQIALMMLYNGNAQTAGNKFIGALNYQQFDVAYNPLIQSRRAEYILFEVPEPVQLNRYNNGYLFLGNKDSGVNFTQVKTPDYYSNAKEAKLIYPNKIYYYRTGPTYLKVWNKNLKTLFVDGVIANPLLVPGFDPEVTDYPASQEVLDVVFKLATAELFPQAQKVSDLINDQRETIETKKINPVTT